MENIHVNKKELIIKELKTISELGKLFSLGYSHALLEHPELSNLDVEVSNSDKHPVLRKTGGFARHQSQTEIKRPLVVIGDKGVEHYRELMGKRKISTDMCAEILGIPRERLTPEVLAVFIFLHELGHGYDYLVNMPKAEDYKSKRDADMASLPVPGWNPALLAQGFEDGSLDKWYEENKEVIEKNGYKSKSELLEVQERAYHELETERFPDNFAATIIKKNREDFLPESDI